MTVLQFKGASADAALLLLQETSVGHAAVSIGVCDPGFDLACIITEGIQPSRGEAVLVDLLWSFSTMAHRLPNLYGFSLLDPKTRTAALTALLIAAQEIEPETGRHLAGVA
jgi:hypothetical protein